MDKNLIRNFCIIAHIDHGKSTLCDRLLEYTGTVSQRDLREQILDNMDLERERGITIKASTVRLTYLHSDGNKYIINLIDTPGHVDFTYEVSKSLSASEGAVLLVDASEGIEAQTVANYRMAREYNLKIIPVINKIDLPRANIEGVKNELVAAFNFKPEEILLASAKTGEGVPAILKAIIERIPAPAGANNDSLKALIFDSSYNVYKGVILYVRIFDGEIRTNMKIRLMNSGTVHQVLGLGVLTPKPKKVKSLKCGEVGYLTCNIKNATEVTVGDTVTQEKVSASKAIPGYKKSKPFVFCGIYSENNKDFEELKKALEKLKLSDGSFTFEQESSESLGFGFRCGFLGLLHSEIIQERLQREFNLSIIITIPSVVYRVEKVSGVIIDVDNPSKLPEIQEIKSIQEPWIKTFIIIPQDYISHIMNLVKDKRGIYISSDYLGKGRLILSCELPLSEIVVDFHDKIKSITKGYGSFDYEFIGYRSANLVKVDIIVNNRPFDAFSFIAHRDKAYYKAKMLIEKLKELIPKQLFEVVIQASIGKKIVSKAKISPLKKYVTGKCYGGDITRKRKLWAKQKRGKNRMKQFGNVEIPQEVFKEILKL